MLCSPQQSLTPATFAGALQSPVGWPAKAMINMLESCAQNDCLDFYKVQKPCSFSLVLVLRHAVSAAAVLVASAACC
jgi:hypothetical protein